MKTPVVISDKDWNNLYMPSKRNKKPGFRDGVPEHEAAPLPSGAQQKWTVAYKQYMEVIAPTYIKAVEAAELITGLDRVHLYIEMGEKQKDFPKVIDRDLEALDKSMSEYPTNGNHQSESNNRGVEPTSLSGPKIQRSTKPRKNKIRARPHRKSR
jgi:hypothetical protein